MVVLGTIIAVPMVSINWLGEAASTQRDQIDTLLDVMIALSSYVFAIVLVMLGFCIWKYKAKPGDESDGEPIHGNTRLEIAWTVIPTVIVLFGGIYSWIVLDDIEAKSADSMPLEITAQQYKWTFEYPQPNGGDPVVSNQLVVPVDQQLDINIRSLDVLHSFWVEEWGIKRDAIPVGKGGVVGDEVDNGFVVTPDKTGTFTVQCTELCGYGHATMRAYVKVVPQDQFDAWLKKQANSGLPAPPVPNAPSGGTTDTGSS
jgi:cytochrome c oxidase subunit 2